MIIENNHENGIRLKETQKKSAYQSHKQLHQRYLKNYLHTNLHTEFLLSVQNAKSPLAFLLQAGF